MNKEILTLRLRDAIADKEWCIARANNDVAKYGEWQCDWNLWMKECQDRIELILRELE
jgi:hypothetical protein